MMNSYEKKFRETIGVKFPFLQYFRSLEHIEFDEEQIQSLLEFIEGELGSEEGTERIVSLYSEINTVLTNIYMFPPRSLAENLREPVLLVLRKLLAAKKRLDSINRDQMLDHELSTLARRLEVLHPMFGDWIEFAIHDLRGQHSTIGDTLQTIFGKVTDRKIGAPMTDVGHELLQRRNDSKVNYLSVWRGKKIKGTSVVLRDGDGKAYGMLCVNIDLDKIEKSPQQVLQDLVNSAENVDENFADNPREMVIRSVQRFDQTHQWNRHSFNELVQAFPWLFEHPHLRHSLELLPDYFRCDPEDLATMLKKRRLGDSPYLQVAGD
jgi:predicted transcriptional regulator YheO